MFWFLLWALLAPQSDNLSVLVLTKTAKYHAQDFEYRHEAIPDARRALEAMGERRGWNVVLTEEATEFTDTNLARFDVVVFLLTTGDVLNDAQQGAFERFIRSGKGYVGVHSAADTEHAWAWYGALVGARFEGHPPIQPATYIVEDRSHPATRHLPETWTRTDEHYSFAINPRERVHVVLALDESSYEPGDGAMGDHPIAWYHDYDGGRAFYTALGHTKASYQEPEVLGLLEGAIRWSAAKSD